MKPHIVLEQDNIVLMREIASQLQEQLMTHKDCYIEVGLEELTDEDIIKVINRLLNIE